MSRRKTISVHDYPEHLNPFSEIHHLQYEPEPFKFHTVGRPKRRASISNAWNLFASRKTKPVEASLNLSPRLPRTSSLANNEIQDPQPPARRKLFKDFSWLPGRRRFGSASQQSSPTTPRRNQTAYPEYATMQRYRSISLTRTSENTVYRPGETPLITPRTHRYRSPSLTPSENDPYKTITGYPTANGGEHYYSVERCNRSSSERFNPTDPPRRSRSSSLSPTANGDPYSTRLHIEEPQSRATSTQALERLYIEEPGDRQGRFAAVNRRLFAEANGDRGHTEQSTEDPSSVSPSSSGERQATAVTPNSERSSPFDEPLVSQRPPRPPRTKKRRAPLPPLPQFAQKTADSPVANSSELRIVESPQQPTVSEEKSNSTKNQSNSSEEQQMVTEIPVEVTEQLIRDTEPNVADKQAITSEQQKNFSDQQTNISEQPLQIVEQQTTISEQQTSVVELQTNISELQLTVTEQQSGRDSIEMAENEVCEMQATDDDETRVGEPENRKEYDEDMTDTPYIDVPEVRKPETKVRTKFGVCDAP